MRGGRREVRGLCWQTCDIMCLGAIMAQVGLA